MTDRDGASGHDRLVTRNFLVLGAGELIGRLIAFGAMVWAARALGAETYGVVGFALAVILYFQSLVDGGLDLLGPRLVAERPEDRPDLLVTIVGSRLLVALGVGAALALVAFPALPSPEDRVLALYGLTLLGFAASTRWLFVGLDRGVPIAVSRLVGGILTVVLVVLLVRDPSDVGLLPVSQAVAELATAGLLALWLGRAGVRPGRFRPELAAEAWRTASPLLGTVILGLVVYNADFVLLRIFSGRTAVGLYLAAYALISFLGQLGNVARLSLLPTLARVRGDPDVEADVNETALARMVLIGLPIAVGGFLVGEDLLVALFGPEYGPAGLPLRLLIWTALCLYARSVIEAFLIARDHQHKVMRATSFAAGLNVALNLVLIPPYGLVGAASATLVTEVLRLGLILRFALAIGYRRPVATRFLRPAAATAAMAAVLLPLPGMNAWIRIGIGVVAFAVAAWALGIVRHEAGGPSLRV